MCTTCILVIKQRNCLPLDFWLLDYTFAYMQLTLEPVMKLTYSCTHTLSPYRYTQSCTIHVVLYMYSAQFAKHFDKTPKNRQNIRLENNIIMYNKYMHIYMYMYVHMYRYTYKRTCIYIFYICWQPEIEKTFSLFIHW